MTTVSGPPMATSVTARPETKALSPNGGQVVELDFLSLLLAALVAPPTGLVRSPLPASRGGGGLAQSAPARPPKVAPLAEAAGQSRPAVQTKSDTSARFSLFLLMPTSPDRTAEGRQGDADRPTATQPLHRTRTEEVRDAVASPAPTSRGTRAPPQLVPQASFQAIVSGRPSAPTERQPLPKPATLHGDQARSPASGEHSSTRANLPVEGTGQAVHLPASAEPPTNPLTFARIWQEPLGARAAGQAPSHRPAPAPLTGMPTPQPVPRTTVVLNLDPPIGRVVVRLRVEGQSIRAVVLAGNGAALRALETSQSEVVAALERGGHKVASVRIAQVGGLVRSLWGVKDGERRRR